MKPINYGLEDSLTTYLLNSISNTDMAASMKCYTLAYF